MDKSGVYAPVYTVEGREFIFAYQDQLFPHEEDAKLQGYQLGAELKKAGSEAKYAGYAIDVTSMTPNDVTIVPILGWKIVFLALKKKRKRGRRGKA